MVKKVAGKIILLQFGYRCVYAVAMVTPVIRNNNTNYNLLGSPFYSDKSGLHRSESKAVKMDPFYTAMSLYRKRNFVQCAQVCSDILRDDGQHQAAWVLKVRALTQRVAYDDTDVLESLAESTSLENHWTRTAPPGTSTVTKTARRDPTAGTNRPPTQSRPLSGVVRLNHSGLGGSHDISNSQTTATAKSRVQTSRLLSRLGTASLSTEAESFINVARLNLVQYAALSQLAKPLFEYLYFVQGDVKNVSLVFFFFKSNCAKFT